MARTAPTARADILGAAARCFARNGYRGTSLREIAQEYGGSKASLLYHFDSKDAILRELTADHWAAIHALVADLRGLDGMEARDAAAAGLIRITVRCRDVVATMHAEVRDIIRTESFVEDGRAMDEIADALAGRTGAPLGEMVARTVLGAVATACRELADAGDEDLATALGALVHGSFEHLDRLDHHTSPVRSRPATTRP